MVLKFGGFGSPDVHNLEEKGDLTGLIDALGYQKDAEVRLAAAQALGRVGDSSVTTALCEALTDEDPRVRKALHLALEKIGDYTAVAQILQMLSASGGYPLTEVNTLAAIFRRVKDTAQQAAIIDTVLAALDKREGAATRAAVMSLANILKMDWSAEYSERLVRALLPWLDDEELYGDALVAINPGVQRLTASDLSAQLAKIVSQDRFVKKAGIRPRALEILEKVIGDVDDGEVRRSARATFKRYMDSQYEDDRLACMQGLGKTGTEDDLRVLIQQFHRDVKPAVQKAAAQAIAQIDQANGVELLLGAINSYDRESEATSFYKTNWYGAVQVLGEIGEAWVFEPLVAILGDEDFYGSPSLGAAAALGKLGDRRAVEPLITALRSNDSYMKKEAAKALQTLTGQDYGDDVDQWQAWWKTSG